MRRRGSPGRFGRSRRTTDIRSGANAHYCLVTVDNERFLSGPALAGRYPIAGLLDRGAMGKVWRMME